MIVIETIERIKKQAQLWTFEICHCSSELGISLKILKNYLVTKL